MKYIITILLLVIGAFAQNTKYKDGTDCECDYILREYYDSGVLHKEIPITNNDTLGWVMTYWFDGGNRIYEKSLYTKIGTVETFYYNTTSGNVIRHYNRTDDHRITGEWGDIDCDTAWYDNGQVESITVDERNTRNYKCDHWRGKQYTRYYENGKIKIQRSDLSSKCIQTQKSFYDNGNLAGVITYKNYEFVSNKCTDGRFGNENLDCLK